LTFPDSEPEPDLAVVRAEDETAAGRHPSTALLVIEIADSSARHDLEVKARLYARAGIPEYWLVLVKDRAIAVLRGPDPAAGEYRDRRILTGAATVTSVAFSGPEVVVQSLFD
jgi:Uma2 family endonuclease